MEKKLKRVLVGGCFDVLHYGHVVFLKKARAVGDHLIVMLESDEYIKKNKKRTPFHNQYMRREILKALRPVDEVVLLPYLKSDKEYFETIKKIAPDIIAVTANDPQLENKKKQAAGIGAQVKIVTKLLPNISSTKIMSYETLSRR